jgi:hypothetical protein
MHWCLSDVVKMHGDGGLRTRYDDWSNCETPTIYPEANPSGAMPDSPIEVVPAPNPIESPTPNETVPWLDARPFETTPPPPADPQPPPVVQPQLQSSSSRKPVPSPGPPDQSPGRLVLQPPGPVQPAPAGAKPLPARPVAARKN